LRIAVLISNSQFEKLGGVVKGQELETIEHKGEQMAPTVEADVASQSPQIIEESFLSFPRSAW
jgi:hypothetical protein